MSGITVKIASLLIRTLSKPIANRIKAQARESQPFRQRCISFAQSIHRVDMRLRLGLLQDPAAMERQAQREAKEAAAKKAKAEIPTVKTEAQAKADELASAKEKEHKESDKAKKSHQPRIRPLSEAKAIETGANFISETFIFVVALSLLFVERWYSSSKENTRRSDIADKLAALEARDADHGKTIEGLKKELDDLRARRGGRWLWDKSSQQKVQAKPDPSKDDNATKPISGAEVNGNIANNKTEPEMSKNSSQIRELTT